MKIKSFHMYSNGDDPPLIKQIEKWLKGKKFSYFKAISHDLRMTEDFQYMYQMVIFYEEEESK